MVLGQQGKHNVDPSKVEVGEIDTSSPFQSVKHAVSLFGAVAFTRRRTLNPSAKKPEPQSFEKVSVKESRLHLAEKELNQLKQNLLNAEVTRSRVLAELYKTRKTIKELNKDLSVVGKSKDVVLQETDKLNDQIKNVQEKDLSDSSDGVLSTWKKDMDTFRVQYLAAALELNAAKQELGKFRLDYDSALRSYNSVVRQSSEAEAATKANSEAATELSGKISEMKDLIEQAKVEYEQAEEEKSRIEASREILEQEYKIKLSESAERIKKLKNEVDVEAGKKLQKQLESIADQSEGLKQDIHNAKASYSELARKLTVDLDDSKASLEKLRDEDGCLRRLIESLKLELENVKKELLELKQKEAAAERLAEDLEAELQRSKLELEASMADESNVRSTCDKMGSTLAELVAETQKARQEAKDFTSQTEAAMDEAEADKSRIKEYEAELELLVQEVEAARSAEAKALEEIKLMSETKESGAKVTLSEEEFNSLSVKVKNSATIADMKVSVAMVQVEAVNARHKNRQQMLEGNLDELEKIKVATAEAIKMAEEAEAGRDELEGELMKLGHSLVPDSKTHWEIEVEPEESYPEGLSRSYSTMSAVRRRVTLGEILKLDREGGKKPTRFPLRSLSGIFRRK